MQIKSILKSLAILKPFIIARRFFIREIHKYNIKIFYNARKQLLSDRGNRKRIYYLGVPVHENLGDLAQCMCIRRFLHRHYSEYQVVEIETNALVNTHFSVLKLLKTHYKKGDFIVFQSGYTTTDLGGHADEMHRAVMSVLPRAQILMMPQTVFFKSKENEVRTSRCYNRMKYMLFLARDDVSFEMAKRMFPDISVQCYPDIVTTLIGTKQFAYKRKGILMCCRDDSEKFYSEEEISNLIERLEEIDNVSTTDTTKYGNRREIVENAEKYIWDEIDKYAMYRCIITDRYHGTIFSLIASTPVIVIKSNDHKVTTGVNWFEGVYDGLVFRADDLNHVFELVCKIYQSNTSNNVDPFFEKQYYDKLPNLFACSIGDE